MEEIRGLSKEQVMERVRKGEVNIIPKAPSRTIGQIIRANLFTNFNILNGVLAIIVIIAGSLKNAMFALVIITNTLIGVLQEIRAKKIIESLSLINKAHVKVIREGKEEEIDIQNLVLDDIMKLDPGDQVLADGKLVFGENLEVDESLLTGEGDPVLKKEGDILLSGSFVVAGSGFVLATKVGKDTYAAKLADEAKKFKLINSELQKSVNKIFKVIIWLVIPIGILLVATQLLSRKTTWQDAIIGAVTGIIGMVPEGLVLLTSATFIVAIIRLSKYKALIQEMPATEILARVDTICLDKTGTITEGRLRVVEVRELDCSKDYPVNRVLSGFAHGFISTNPTLNAVYERYKEMPKENIISSVPFSSQRKWSGLSFQQLGTWILGAPEVIMKRQYESLKYIVENEAENGRRVLLLAKYEAEHLTERIEGEIKPVALVIIEDIIREEAPRALNYFRENKVDIKIISGDNPITVSAIAKEAGVIGAEKYIDARYLPEDTEELGKILEDNVIFGRVTPHQKKNIVRALQGKGHVVAMTGDGVNDVLALKEADCGIAMANGSDAAKAVSQLVLLTSDFSALPKVVAEGRKLINNIERVSELFLSKTSYSILLSIIFSISLLPFPILPVQLTLIGSLAIGIPSFFLAMVYNREPVKKGFLKRVLSVAIPNGLVLGTATSIIFILAYVNNLSLEECRTLAVIVLSALSVLVLYRVARPINIFKLILVGTIILAFLVVFIIPFISDVFTLSIPQKSYVFIAIFIIILFSVVSDIAIKIVTKFIS